MAFFSLGQARGLALTGLLFWGVAFESLCAQTSTSAQFEGLTIVSISYSPNSYLEPSDLAEAQPLKTGEPFHAAQIADAIDSLFATGQFDDISVDAEPEGKGVAVRFLVQSRIFIQDLQFRGKIHSPPNTAELRSFSQLRLGASLKESDITAATASLNDLLKSNGFFSASVTPSTTYSGDGNQALITFQVKDGKRAKYQEPVIEGETLLPDSVILRASGWRIPIIHWWRTVTAARTNGGVHGILTAYQKKDRLMATVDLTKTDHNAETNRVAPHLSINPGPVVQVKAVEAKVSRRILKRYVPVFEQRAVDNELLLEGKRNLQDYFESKGYYDVDVDFRIRPVVNDVETIEYAISKGKRQKVAQVSITGNRYFDEHTIRERMFIQPATFSLRHGRYSDAFRRRDEQDVADLYRSNGFRDVKVTISTEGDYKGKAGDIAVTAHIEEGKQWLVTHLTINGPAQLDLEELRNTLASSVGQPFAELNLASDRESILIYYYQRGFPSATVDVSWKPVGANDADVTYNITEGKRQYVRGVLISGNDTTRWHLLNQTITMNPGDPLSPIEQTRIQQNLYNLGIFARVDTAIENSNGTAAHKYVLYDLQESNRYSFTVGAGLQVGKFGVPDNTLGSPGGSTTISPDVSLDVTRLNFLGLGHTISFRTNYSRLDKLGALTYLQPRFMNHDGRNISYTLLYENELDVRTFAALRAQASVQVTQKLSRSLTAQLGYAFRRVSVSDVVIPVLLIPQFTQPVRIGIVTANLVRDHRNTPENPTRGSYSSINLGIAARALGSERTFGRLLLRNATYYKLTHSLILARQTQLGIIAPYSVPAGLTSESVIPLPERFFGGGADSLRAFPFNQAGPRDTGAPQVAGGPSSQPTGFPLGGNALIFNNVELRFPLLGENIQGVFFHDMGNVFSSVGAISLAFHQKNLTDFNYTVHAVGFGVRYRTPVGPIRVDLAYSINPPAYNGFGGTSYELLSCNPDLPPSSLPGYCTPSHQRISHIQFFFSIGQTF